MKGIRLEVILLETGELRVNGNLENKIVCLGMLDLAKDLVRRFEPEKESGLIVASGLPNGGMFAR